MVYGYCRVSTKHQRIARQITNIKELYPTATIIKEFYTGTTQNRPRWDWLMKQIRPDDTIVFDSVSRMSRNAAEGLKDYKILYELGIHLIFLNEPLINTSVFESTKNNLLEISVQTGNTAVDDYFKFLSSGGSDSPVELLKLAGVDLTKMDAFDSCMASFKAAREEFEALN